ncbi:hypothetical protein SAZ10_08200 [Mesorhizobium sp. BAC0120]|uniref:hypothetical protein n=1 Tax=Mesorhizobium sp. BAC0120 TaxID=3090670 RepID=UPI00298C136F|nr:hypothetical protein [Mesorhizobium sp. BAC0120]MDW6021745.1 hypothetical protein [Mesorhizobium sp. BAC0120]
MTKQHEPTLDELLSEPIILTVMARDGVRSADIRRLLQEVRNREEHAPGAFPNNPGRWHFLAMESAGPPPA